jgi:hypothetical protein
LPFIKNKDTNPFGDSVTVNRSFTIQASWNVNRCKIVVWIQNSTTREVYQAGFIKITDLTGIVDKLHAFLS